jgi:GGDEF domain-containing protein
MEEPMSATFPSPAPRTDPDTGLYAPWYLEARTDEELSRALRSGRKVFLVTMTAYTKGATAGLANWLRSALRVYDLAGCIGRGRFAVVLTQTDDDGVMSMLKRAQAAVLTPVDIGVATFPDDGITFGHLLERADGVTLAA